MNIRVTNIDIQQNLEHMYTMESPVPQTFSRGSCRVSITGELLGSYKKFKELCSVYHSTLFIVTDDDTLLGTEEAKLLTSMLQDIKKLLPVQPTLSVVDAGKPLLSYILSELTDITNAIKQQNISSNR